LVARAEGSRLLIVSATRPVSERQLRSERRTTIQLSPLTAAQIGELLDSVAARDPGEIVAAWPELLAEAADGNPLLTMELIQLAQERGVVAIVDGSWRCADDAALHALMGAGEGIRQRLGRLGPESRELMLLLAISGTPLHIRVLAAATSTDPTVLRQRLDLLERHGMVQGSAETWEPAHDEIAAAAAALFSEQAAAVRTRLAAALAEHGDGLQELGRAASHYVVLGNTDALARLVRRRLELARRNGSPERPDIAVTHLLGTHSSGPLRSAVLASLPLSLRLRPRLPVALAAAGILLAAAIAGTQSPTELVPDATFEVAWYGPSGELETGVVNVRRQGWDPSEPLDVVPATRPLLRHLRDPHPGVPIRYTPSGDSAVTVLRRPGTSNEEIALLTADSLEWLTDDERDDLAPRFLPDGSGIVFLTSRWSPVGDDDTDLARLDFATRTVTRLTSGQDWDITPAVSPDGTRLAFIRRYRDGSTSDLCVISWRAAPPICQGLKPTPEAELLDWLDLTSVLLRVDSLGTAIGIRVDVRSGATATATPTSTATAVVDAKNSFLACLCENAADKRLGLQIGPVKEPGENRTVRVPGDRDPRRISLVRSGSPSLALERLEIRGVEGLTAGSQFRLATIGYNALGQRVAFDTSTIRWSVADTTIARVDSVSGLLVALREGDTQVHATAAGWRESSIAVRIGKSTAQQVLLENWGSDWKDRWRAFGEPRAIVGPHPTLGSVMRNNGDGRHMSGV
jgi:hypothetical protein